jgi:hypothetical protein
LVHFQGCILNSDTFTTEHIIFPSNNFQLEEEGGSRFEVFMATIMKTAVFWDLNLRSLVEGSGSIVAS